MENLEALREGLHKVAVQRARDNFYAYVCLMAPVVIPEKFVDGRHIKLLCEAAQEGENGKQKRQMVFLPPGSTKSKIMSVLFPSWVVGRHPNWPILQISHSAELAQGFGREVRDLMGDLLYQEIFPGVNLRADVQAAGRWMTTMGGKYYAAGAGAHIAGMRAKIAILDDLLSEQTARSKTEREAINSWYAKGLRSRLLPGGSIIIVNTRWHVADLSGYLLQQSAKDKKRLGWKVISIPAILDSESAKLLGLSEGDSYWPEYWPLQELLQIKADNIDEDWSALYMQSPIVADGSIFKEKYLKIWPTDEPPNCVFILQTLDTASTAETYSDYSVIQTWGIYEHNPSVTEDLGPTVHNLILLENYRERLEYPELRKKVVAKYNKWKPDVMLIEKKASGISLLQDLRLAGAPVQEFLPDRDKVARAYAATPLMNAGRVWIPKWENRPSIKSLVDELKAFSASKSHAHDDMVDALVMAVLYLKSSFYLIHPDDPEFPKLSEKKHKTYWNSLV